MLDHKGPHNLIYGFTNPGAILSRNFKDSVTLTFSKNYYEKVSSLAAIGNFSYVVGIYIDTKGCFSLG